MRQHLLAPTPVSDNFRLRACYSFNLFLVNSSLEGAFKHAYCAGFNFLSIFIHIFIKFISEDSVLSVDVLLRMHHLGLTFVVPRFIKFFKLRDCSSICRANFCPPVAFKSIASFPRSLSVWLFSTVCFQISFVLHLKALHRSPALCQLIFLGFALTANPSLHSCSFSTSILLLL